MKFLILLCVAGFCSAATQYTFIGRDASLGTPSVVHSRSAVGTTSGCSTYIGESKEYRVARLITDSAGNSYVTGARLFPAPSNRTDVFVTKLDSSCNRLFISIIGGDGSGEAKSIALDSAGNIYIVGSTSSTDFPLNNPLQSQPSSAFLAKLDPDGSRILYSTYFSYANTLGFRTDTSINSVAVDSDANIYLTGSTGALEVSIAAHSPAFVAKVASSGDRIVYSAQIGGDAIACGGGSSCFLSLRLTTGIDIALDSAGNAYMAGNAGVTDLPTTTGAFLRKGIGAFVAKVNAAGSLVYLTYVGAANYPIGGPSANPGNRVSALAVDAAGAVFIAGSTNDPQFPATSGALQTAYAGPDSFSPPFDAFIAKLKPDGSGMVWATYLGGPASDSARSIALDASGAPWITGVTSSPDFPNADGWNSGGDFLVRLNSSGSALLYSARFPDGSTAQASTLDRAGAVHLAGTSGIVSTLIPSQPTSPHVLGMANAAAGATSGRIAPGELISIYGPHIGPITPAISSADGSGRIAKSLSGVEVVIGGFAAPLLYVSDSQINAIVPFGLSGVSYAVIRISLNGATTADYPVAIVPTAPQMFRNPDGSVIARNEDGSINSPANPARSDSIVSFWVTGTGAIPAEDGAIETTARNDNCCQVYTSGVLGFRPVEILYAGASPGIVAGVTQINVQLPPSLGSFASITIQVIARDGFSNQATLYVAR